MAKSIASILDENKEHTIIGFLGTNEELKDNKNNNIFKSYKLIGDKSLLSDLGKKQDIGFVVAIGDPKVRELVYSKAIGSKLYPIKVISKNSIISQTSKIAEGSIIKHGVIIGPNVDIGENTIIDNSSIIEINSQIGPNCTIESSVLLNGDNIIKKNVLIRFRSTISANVCIGKNQLIKENSFIKSDLEDISKNKY